MERRPAPPRGEYDDLLNRLTEQNTSGIRVFETKQKGMMYAAALGYALKKRVPLASKATAIRYDVFQSAFDDGFIRALAVAETGDLKVLGEDREDERIDIFEEYAHGGLEEMHRICISQEGDPLDNLIRRTLEIRASGSEIPGIDAAVLQDLLGG